MPLLEPSKANATSRVWKWIYVSGMPCPCSLGTFYWSAQKFPLFPAVGLNVASEAVCQLMGKSACEWPQHRRLRIWKEERTWVDVHVLDPVISYMTLNMPVTRAITFLSWLYKELHFLSFINKSILRNSLKPIFANSLIVSPISEWQKIINN